MLSLRGSFWRESGDGCDVPIGEEEEEEEE